MNPRYFIAITLPDDIRSEIGRVQHELFEPGRVMQPLKPHITLLDPNILSAVPPIYLLPKLRVVSQTRLPIEIKLTRTSMFDKRVLYIDIESFELYKFQEELVKLLPEKVLAQYTVNREFNAHITIAQSKPKQKLSEDLIEKYRMRIEPLLPYSFEVSQISQFTWLRPRVYKIKPI